MEKIVSKFGEDLIKKYDEDSNKGYIFEVYVEGPKNLLHLHSDLPSLLERMEIKNCNKLVCSLYDEIIGCSYKNIQKSIKAWINTKKKYIVYFNLIKKRG